MSGPLSPPGLGAGFADPVGDAQQSFRRIMDAMARPGTVVEVGGAVMPPAPLMPATAAVLLTLADLDTPLWLDPMSADAAGYVAFHCGCTVVPSPEQAVFGVFADGRRLDGLGRFAVGEADYPDRAATVVIQVAGLGTTGGRRLSGPGIDGEARLAVDGLDDGFWAFQAGNRLLFPLGIDVVLACGHRLAALPRSVTVREA